MVYVGSKTKLKKDLLPVLNSYIKKNQIENFYSVCCGGCNLEFEIECKNVFCSDLSPTLIALHQQAQKAYSKIPTETSRELWDLYKAEQERLVSTYPIELKVWEEESLYPLYQIGAIEFFSSYSGGGFHYGYATTYKDRNYFKERYNNLKKQSSTEGYQKINFSQHSYENTVIKPNSIIYVDPPYKNVRGYQINKNKFDHEKFYSWVKEQNCPVFISEQQMPPDFKLIWEKDVYRSNCTHNNKKATEKLYIYEP